MVFLSIIFGILLSVSQAWAAIGNVGNFGIGQSTTSENTCVITTTATLNVGNIAIVYTGFDNTGTSDGTSSEITSVTDSAGNTYAAIGSFRNAQGSAGAGIVVAAYMTKATSQLTSGGTITVTYANAINSKACGAMENTVDSGKTLQLAGTVQTLANDATDPGSMSISGLNNREYLFVRLIADEGRGNSISVPTSGYTVVGASQADTGIDATAAQILGERDILIGTGSTSNPTLSDTDDDFASIFFALEEVSVAPPSGTKIMIITFE